MLRAAERALFAIGFCCLAVVGAAHLRAWRFADDEGARVDALLRESASGHGRTRAQARPGRAFARIEIPARRYSALVAEGVDDDTLRLAVGHVPQTAFPGESGNVALAGHRDSFFRVLKDVRTDDEVRLHTPDGSFSYRIVSRSVLEPTRTDVLEASGDVPLLTLVTCYPFGFIGRAPLRYVVTARQQPR
jgi:sortase A